MANASLSAAADPAISLDELARCVRALDAATRALLDLSVRRKLRDDAMSPMLKTDPFHLAWRRARALERVASDLGGDPPPALTDVRAALAELPDEAWAPLPQLMPPASRATLALVVRDGETGTDLVPAGGGRLARFAHSAPPLGASLRAVAVAAAGAMLRLVVRRPGGGQAARA